MSQPSDEWKLVGRDYDVNERVYFVTRVHHIPPLAPAIKGLELMSSDYESLV